MSKVRPKSLLGASPTLGGILAVPSSDATQFQEIDPASLGSTVDISPSANLTSNGSDTSEIQAGATAKANFGATTLAYTPPSGYNAGVYV